MPVWHLPTVPYEYNLHSHLSLVPRGSQSAASPDDHAISLNKRWHTVSPWRAYEVKEPTVSQQRTTKAPPLSHGVIDKDRITFMGKTESLKVQVTTTADLGKYNMLKDSEFEATLGACYMKLATAGSIRGKMTGCMFFFWLIEKVAQCV